MPRINQLRCLITLLIVTTGSLSYLPSKANQVDLTQQQSELLAKKSGGRSGGGSFKSRPSRSNSPKRSSPQKTSNPRRNNYNRPASTSPNYNREYQRDYHRSTPGYSRTTTSRRSGSGELIFLSLFLLTGIILFFLVYRSYSQTGSKSSSSKSERKIARERDNDRVTVSMLQVALSLNIPPMASLQGELSELSLNTDTSSDTGLVQLMQEAALILLRNAEAWTHVLAQSETLDLADAESAFDKLSMRERSKFSGETLSNVDGAVATKESKRSEEDNLGSYVVVTLIVGTADDRPLFGKIDNEASLQEALLQLSSMRDDFLIKLELLWTPQAAPQYLSDDELLLEYSNMLPLI